MDNVAKITSIVSAAAASYFPIIGSIGGAILGYIVGTATSTISGYYIAIMLIEWTFQKVPLLVLL
ncbi:hypothetical protein H2278_01720 [Campylobacter sp. W0018]|uniref:hypothetical protein n=1 Tax=Campylobacter sp. W0018 TaxID=2735782 RepID=UPI00301D91D7|nr:hypothetical protein [Campylobacter sp. W0018]